MNTQRRENLGSRSRKCQIQKHTEACGIDKEAGRKSESMVSQRLRESVSVRERSVVKNASEHSGR